MNKNKIIKTLIVYFLGLLILFTPAYIIKSDYLDLELVIDFIVYLAYTITIFAYKNKIKFNFNIYLLLMVVSVLLISMGITDIYSYFHQREPGECMWLCLDDIKYFLAGILYEVLSIITAVVLIIIKIVNILKKED